MTPQSYNKKRTYASIIAKNIIIFLPAHAVPPRQFRRKNPRCVKKSTKFPHLYLHNPEKSSNFAAMFRPTYIYGLFLSLAVVLTACTPRSVREAQTVVTEADSLWHNGQMYGIDAGDSATLAEAYQKLDRAQAIFPDEFAHSCYHYGRLLLKKDNQVEAMQAFLAATHSRTRDYHILGRVYSNMGEICHLAGEYNLSYDMFEKSAEMYLRNGDTLLYYYDLNNMAFELAEQGKKDSTLYLIREIEDKCTDGEVLNKAIETKAEAFFQFGQFDSALYYANVLCAENYFNIIGLLIKAQSYSFLHEYDSATYYANIVISCSSSLFDIHNALYILTNDDYTKDNTSIRETAAKRSDVQKLIEIQHGKLSQATQLLEIDLNRKPNYVKITFLVLGVIGISLFLCLALIRLNHKHKQINEKINYQLAQEKNLQLRATDYYKKQIVDLENNCEALRKSKNLKKELGWDDYNSMCSVVNLRMNGMVNKLTSIPNITSNDIRLCILVLLDISYSDIADMLNLSPKSIAKLKSITAHKLNTTMKDLRTTLIEIVCKS